jgi:photosystem II stability/assembly factor-like uncharacterized protein
MSLTTSYGTYTTPSTRINAIYTNPKRYWSISSSSDGKYVLTVGYNDNICYLSTNYGKDWSVLYNTNNNGILSVTSCNVSSDGRYMIIGTITRHIIITRNYGSTWTKTPVSNVGNPEVMSHVTISDDGNYIVLGTSRQVLISTDSGSTWTQKFSYPLPERYNFITASTNGKYICNFRFSNPAVSALATTFKVSIDFGNNWSDISATDIDSGLTYITNIKLSSTGQTTVVAARHSTDGLCIFISNDFIKSRINNTSATWRRTNFPSLIKYNYSATQVPLYTDISYNKPLYTSLTLTDASYISYFDIALSSNGQHIKVSVPATSIGGSIKNDANIFISKDFGNTYNSILDDLYHNLFLSYIVTSRSGTYNIITGSHANTSLGNIYNYVSNIYTYSYTPIKISYDNTFNFTFTSTLYDCSGTYYLKNENNQILSTKVINTDTTTSITFTDISTNLFDYGMSRLFVYKSDIGEFDDIQISDPMVINATCFLEGTKILAMDKRRIIKYIPIEKLKPGMLVKTLSSGFVPIKYIGYSTIYNPGLATRVRDQLFKCTKSAYPELTEDLVLTGNHSILVEKITDEQREQITETLGDIYVTEQRYRLPAFNDKRAVPYDQRGDFRIWNLALENEDYYANYGIYANGLLVETTSCRYITELSKMTLVE